MLVGRIEAEPPSTTEHSGLPIDHFFEQKLKKVLTSTLVRTNPQLKAYITKWTDPEKAKRMVNHLKFILTSLDSRVRNFPSSEILFIFSHEVMKAS